jgi:hypothetical protein
MRGIARPRKVPSSAADDNPMKKAFHSTFPSLKEFICIFTLM